MCDRSGVGSIHARTKRSESLVIADRRWREKLDFRQIFNVRWGVILRLETTNVSMNGLEISIYFELKSQEL